MRRSVAWDVALMSVCYCLGMSALFSSVTVVSLVVDERVSPSLALLPPALQKLVQTAASFPGARHRNKRGFVTAAVIGSIGYAVCAVAVACISKEKHPQASFVVLCVGYCISGLSDPFVQFLRFSAGEIANGPFKARAVSYVVAGGAFAAVFGPELSRTLVDLIPGRKYAGSYCGACILLLVECVLIECIDFTPASKKLEQPTEGAKSNRNEYNNSQQKKSNSVHPHPQSPKLLVKAPLEASFADTAVDGSSKTSPVLSFEEQEYQ